MPNESHEKRAQLKEGMLKKGGINDRPSKPKPDVTPVAQKPAPESDAQATSAVPSKDS